MIKTIEKPCPGNCSICTYPNEIPGFDLYGCALNQTLQRTISLEKQMQELMTGTAEKVIIKHTEGTNDETSNEELS